MVARNLFQIVGGKPLAGEVEVQAMKNSVLHLLFASLLSDEPVIIQQAPRLTDVQVGVEILEHLGATAAWHGRDLHLHASSVERSQAPYRLVSKMRASFVVMGALLARTGEARVSMPGGCAFGPRPVDRHLKAFADLGVEITEDGDDFVAKRLAPLQGRVVFEAPTVGGTQNVLLATALGAGEVEIENAALEPEVADLADLLNAMGARIEGAGTPWIRIQGVDRLHGTRFRPIPDRIEAGTFMLAAAATRGDIVLRGVRMDHVGAVRDKLVEAGVRMVDEDRDALRVDATGELRSVDVTATEFPGLPTDLQAPFGAFLATVPGLSVVRDRVYPERFTHVDELRKMGAKLELSERTLVVHGGKPMVGTDVHAADLRAGMALVLAGLAADGTTLLSGVEYLDRGYERLAERLSSLGASVLRLTSSVESPASVSVASMAAGAGSG